MDFSSRFNFFRQCAASSSRLATCVRIVTASVATLSHTSLWMDRKTETVSGSRLMTRIDLMWGGGRCSSAGAFIPADESDADAFDEL
jgi:hypothetical protein